MPTVSLFSCSFFSNTFPAKSPLVISISSFIPTHPRPFFTMASTSNSAPLSHNPFTTIPGMKEEEIVASAKDVSKRYSSHNLKRNGSGVTIMWFRNDLRLLDNEALHRAWLTSNMLLPVYCVDPRLFGTTHNFGFPKTGALRAKFLIESLVDLKKNLVKSGLNLLIQIGKPEDVLPVIARKFGAHTVFAHKETCSEEIAIERLVSRRLELEYTKLQLIWGMTMHHIDDLPFKIECLQDVFTQFRKCVESRSKIRSCCKSPFLLGPLPTHDQDEDFEWGNIPSLDDLGLQQTKSDKGMRFLGGESASLSRVDDYFWKKDLIKVYKETRNGMLGSDYSTKFSPWLAFGCLSPRYIYEEVKRYEKEREANDSTYWVLFELLWRDYFRFLSIKYGNSIFQIGGPKNKTVPKWSQDQQLFESWKQGKTGYPLIDANMKELKATGFMSNRGRQIVCSFLVRDMGIDWRMGAEWFETCLLDYDPCSNYGNWTYGAGVGNDPREDRYFSIIKQAKVYDPEGKYVAYWLPELCHLPIEKRNFPGQSYIKQVVPLKYGNSNPKKTKNQRSTMYRK